MNCATNEGLGWSPQLPEANGGLGGEVPSCWQMFGFFNQKFLSLDMFIYFSAFGYCHTSELLHCNANRLRYSIFLAVGWVI